MSADNWGVCPKCKRLAEQKAVSAYGKVSEEEYLATLANRDKAAKEQNLREDYEVGTDKDGKFYVSYGCSCDKCGFSFEFNHKQNLI